MNVSIRQIQGQEMLEALYALDQYCLNPSPPFQNKEEWMTIVRDRKGLVCHAVYEEETPVSIAVSSPMTQNIRGALVPASGIWGVSTHPSARYKGYCRQTLASLLSAEYENGKAFSNLYPFRESFYERLGYVSFPLTKIARLAPSSLSPLLKLHLEGEIELKLIGEAYESYREYLSDMRPNHHGMAFFDFGDQAMANRNRLWAALARFSGNIEGLMLYSLQGEEVTKYKFFVPRFYYSSSRSRYLLLNWIARHTDQADRAELWLPADEFPETWLADLQIKVESAIRAPMSRVLNVAAINGMQVGVGDFAANIIDPLCPWNQGAWHFEAWDKQLRVSKTSQANFDLTIQGLTALITGTHDPQDLSLRGWGNPDAVAQTIQRNMFPKLYPYLHENF